MKNNIREVLDILQEECAETIQAVSKCNRFGLDNYKPGKPLTNRHHLEEELGDLMAMIELLVAADVVDQSRIDQAKKEKFNKLKRWSTIDFSPAS